MIPFKTSCHDSNSNGKNFLSIPAPIIRFPSTYETKENKLNSLNIEPFRSTAKNISTISHAKTIIFSRSLLSISESHQRKFHPKRINNGCNYPSSRKNRLKNVPQSHTWIKTPLEEFAKRENSSTRKTLASFNALLLPTRKLESSNLHTYSNETHWPFKLS